MFLGEERFDSNACYWLVSFKMWPHTVISAERHCM